MKDSSRVSCMNCNQLEETRKDQYHDNTPFSFSETSVSGCVTILKGALGHVTAAVVNSVEAKHVIVSREV